MRFDVKATVQRALAKMRERFVQGRDLREQKTHHPCGNLGRGGPCNAEGGSPRRLGSPLLGLREALHRFVVVQIRLLAFRAEHIAHGAGALS